MESSRNSFGNAVKKCFKAKALVRGTRNNKIASVSCATNLGIGAGDMNMFDNTQSKTTDGWLSLIFFVHLHPII